MSGLEFKITKQTNKTPVKYYYVNIFIIHCVLVFIKEVIYDDFHLVTTSCNNYFSY